MKKFFAIAMALLIHAALAAQSITLPPSGDNQKSSVTQWIGLASVTINYNSPDVTGPQGEVRKGHIWGELVPYGFTDPEYGTSTSAPWRAGANENTTIAFSHDVRIGGKDIKAGTYGVFLIVEKDKPWTWIISKDHTNWGHYHYDPARDVVRVEATPGESEYTEWLTFGFDKRLPASTVAYLQWENKRIDLSIEVPRVDELYLEKIRADLQGHRMGFTAQSWIDAARFCVEKNINLEEALEWSDYAISGRWIGEENFESLQMKAMVLEALERTADADAVMAKALSHPTATVPAVHQYARTLQLQGKNEKALEVFKLNRKNHPDDKFTTYVGLARGYAATGDKKNALKNWEFVLKNLPKDQERNRKFYEEEFKKLQ